MKLLHIRELNYKAYPTSEVAKGLNVSHETIKRYIREGRLRSVKIGTTIYVPLTGLKEFLEGDYSNSEHRCKSNGKKDRKKHYFKRLKKQ
jgi:excisionase family DNA binding protein